MKSSYATTTEPVKPIINGRVLIELRDGHVTLFPITDTDQETAELLDAILDHIAVAIRKSRKTDD